MRLANKPADNEHPYGHRQLESIASLVVGAFVGVEILLTFKALGWIDLVSPFLILLVVLLVGMLASGLLAVTVERIAYRPLRGAPRLIPLISAIGVSFFLQDAVRLVESIWRNAFNLVYPTMETLNLRFSFTETIDVSVKSLVVIVASLLMLWGLHALVNRTKIGKAIRAVAEDQATASLMGINVNRMISLTFLIGGAMGGAAGVLFGVQYSLINPYTGFIPGLKAFTAAVLGGIGNIPAPCWAAWCWACSKPSPPPTCRSSPAAPSGPSTRTSSPSPS
jgi:branched-chain amino acid transport system permease protein